MTEKEIEATLKPCPFCGYENPKFTSKRSGNYRRTGDMVQVLCGKCKARGPIITAKFDKPNVSRFVAQTYNQGLSGVEILQIAADKWNNRR